MRELKSGNLGLGRTTTLNNIFGGSCEIQAGKLPIFDFIGPDRASLQLADLVHWHEVLQDEILELELAILSPDSLEEALFLLLVLLSHFLIFLRQLFLFRPEFFQLLSAFSAGRSERF